MTNEEAINVLKSILKRLLPSMHEERKAIMVAFGALIRDKKVDDIVVHWDDEKNNFVSACNAFEDILEVYGRGVEGADNGQS